LRIAMVRPVAMLAVTARQQMMRSSGVRVRDKAA
jgi:hypothetical protein